MPAVPQPDALGRNGTYVVFRKLHQTWPRSAGTCSDHAAGAEEQELLAAKFVGRWRSGAPLVLRPSTTIPSWAPTRPATTPSYHADDATGLQMPRGSTHPADEPPRLVIAGAVASTG